MNLNQAIAKYRDSSEINCDGASCYSITPRLAADSELNEKQQELIDALQVGIEAGPASESDEIFYRGMSYIHIKPYAECVAVNYRPFISVSKNIGEACRFLIGNEPVFLKIYAPVGVKRLHLSSPNASLEKEEYLFSRNSTITISELSLNELTESEQINLNLMKSPLELILKRINIITR